MSGFCKLGSKGISEKGREQLSVEDKKRYNGYIEINNEKHYKILILERDNLSLKKIVKVLKNNLSNLETKQTKQKSEFDFFFEQDRFLKDALVQERKDSASLLEENISLKGDIKVATDLIKGSIQERKDRVMDLKAQTKSCLEELIVLKKENSNLKKENLIIPTLEENKSLHLEKIKYLEIQINSYQRTLNDSQRRESTLNYKVDALERKLIVNEEVWGSNNKRKRLEGR